MGNLHAYPHITTINCLALLRCSLTLARCHTHRAVVTVRTSPQPGLARLDAGDARTCSREEGHDRLLGRYAGDFDAATEQQHVHLRAHADSLVG